MAKKKRSSNDMKRVQRKRKRRKRLASLVVASSLATVPQTVFAQLPTGGNVAAGAATIQAQGNTLNVNASSSRAIVNWDSFNVGAGKQANFNLPSSNSAILNRVVTPQMPSSIHGTVQSNGHVHLVNPSGILVGAQGVVNTNGFVATTFDVANDAFMKGQGVTYSNNGSTAAVVNQGTINTGSGGAHLIANQIQNSGAITSNGGNVTMSGGSVVKLENGVTYVQPSKATLASGISPTAGLIQNTGTIRATGAATVGGEVYLVNPNGKILHDGTIAAKNIVSKTNTTGGSVRLEADDIVLSENSSIDASGPKGGGEVLVGGDWQGSGTMTQATTVTMESGASVDASANESGDGGTVVIWSDITNSESSTKVAGTLKVQAGHASGNGGRVETSGQKVDTAGVTVDASAKNGDGGLWLIDPFNYEIDATAAANIASSLNTGTSVTVTTTADNAAHGSSGNSLDQGDITVTSDIVTGAMSGNATLTLEAARHIQVDADIDATQNGNTASLNVTLLADTDHSGDGINIVTTDAIKTNGGNLTFGDGATATIGGLSVKVGGDVYINGAAAQSLETSGGAITINGETIVANSVGGVTFDSSGGDIVFGGLLNSGNQYTYVDGPDGQANSWDWARTDARNGTAGGAAEGDSYMATITSRLENAIAGIAADYRGAWIGAYRATPASSYDWTWADGPEAAQVFFVQANPNGGTTQPGWYSNFGASEPNGLLDPNGESRGQFFGNAGQWNDLPATTQFSATQDSQYSVLGYVRETNLAATPVTINAGAGSVTMDGGIGNRKALASLNVTSAATTVNGSALVTTGAQDYSSALTVNSTTGLTVVGTTLTAGGAIDLAATSNVDMNASLVVTGAISITGDSVIIGDDLTTTGAGDVTISSSQLSGTGDIALADGRTLTIDQSEASTYGGVISGTDASLVKSGVGDLGLGAVSTYGGSTTINDGILSLAIADALPDTTDLIVNTNGTFSLNGFDETVGSISGSGLIVNGAVVRPGLVLWLDAGNESSYDGTGTAWYDLSGNEYDAEIFGNPELRRERPACSPSRQTVSTSGLRQLPADFLGSTVSGVTVFTVANFGNTSDNWERVVDLGNVGAGGNARQRQHHSFTPRLHRSTQLGNLYRVQHYPRLRTRPERIVPSSTM